ncbi:VOC family protein [Enterococcus rotai]|uniref:VOC family protein n=1 Tax=Enterococcus rotai TaxID=118060 RepID=UPI0035C74544
MPIATYFSFDDQSKDAIKFYETAFDTSCHDLVTYATLGMPDLDEKSQKMVMNASLEIEGHTIMFSDTPSFMNKIPYGRNVGLVIEVTEPDKLTRYFTKLSEDATNIMPLQKTDWSELFGQVTDKFGINWSFNLI